jgi:hypothetical protein
MEKGYFPHWFNTRANAEYSGPVPAASFFKPENMMAVPRAKFDAWHAEATAKTTPNDPLFDGHWVLQSELERYCDNDVAILREGCIKFRQMFLDLSEQKCDPFTYITIASTCHALYCAAYMPENSIAILPAFVATELRNAMFGGRTNARKLVWEQRTASHTAHYMDYTSLYPFVQWARQYPYGHPRLIGDWNRTSGTDTWRFFKRMKANNQAAWQMPEMAVTRLTEYLRDGTLAVLLCDVECPDDLYHPVLPSRMESGKLLFDLRAKKEQWFTSVELKKAIELGYTVTRIHRVAIWETVTTSLFGPYVETFLRIKQEASGWPDGCETEAQKQAYIASYERHQGIRLRRECIVRNDGLREVAKLCLNSLWGKFCQRPNMRQTDLFDDPSAYLKCVFDARHCDVSVVPIHNPEGDACDGGLAGMYEVQYRMREGVVRHSDKVNIAIGVFTTAHARLHLYSAFETLGTQVLYYDTDSVIYEYDAHDAAHVHLTTGDYLGDFKDELGGAHIVKFISGGPKNYGYVVNDTDASGPTECVKIKGFHLKRPETAALLSLSVMEKVVRERGAKVEMVSGDGTRVCGKRKVTVHMETIARDKKRKIVVNKMVSRSYRLVFDKGVVQDDFSVLPFGHRDTHEGALGDDSA